MSIIVPIIQLILLFAAVSPKSFEYLRVNHWSIEDGLPMNSVMSIAQTADGYLWLGTETGLVRFDGVEFDVFNHENTKALGSEFILSLEASRSGVLWIGTRGGGLIRLQNGLFKSYTKDNGLTSNDVWAILETRDKSLWIGNRNGINRLTDEKLETIALPEKLSTVSVRAFLEDRIGRIWVGTRGDGLILVEKSGYRFESRVYGFSGMKITELLEDREGNIWVGTAGSGLACIRANQPDPPVFFHAGDEISFENIECLLEDQVGNIWIGTYGEGVFVLKKNGSERLVRLSDRQELESDRINVIFEDHENTLWIGTVGGGLHNIRETRITTYNTKNGLSNDYISAVFQDSRENIWIGGFKPVVDFLSAKNHQFQSIEIQDGASAVVVSIAEHPDGFFWFSTFGDGIYRYDMKSKKTDQFLSKHGISDTYVRVLYVDSTKQLWAGADDGGLHVFNGEKFTLLQNLKFKITSINQDRHGDMWFGTGGGGLYRLTKEGQLSNIDKSNGLASQFITSVYHDEQGVLWIGTISGGLNRLEEGRITKIGKSNGLPDNTVYCILEDQKNNLWMSSNRGIIAISRNMLRDLAQKKIERIFPVVLSKEDGMESIECNGGFQPACWKANDGKLWFPTIKGVSVVDPNRIGIHTVAPFVQIKKVIIDERNYSVEKKAVAPPGRANVEIHYTGLSFIAPKKIQYQYKIDGLDAAWINAGAHRMAHYAGLDPGSYRFRVKACNSDGVWSNPGAYYDFEIKAGFYETRAFQFGFPLGLLLCVLIGYHFGKKIRQVRKLRKKYQGSNLTPDETISCLQKITHLMEVDKAFKDAELSLELLADKCGQSPRNLSRIINEQTGKNFYEFVNTYRVKEAQKLLVHPQYRSKSILEISFEVGFNSKSAFNRAFKAFTDLTPSQYKKKSKQSDA